ncbi:MAG: hypothetical protein J5379_08460 [Clostridiales bacterium]|nr:hypothetical protein [Clostridiales bacterium]
MMDDPSYFNKAMTKIRIYTNSGMIPGSDILFTFERSDRPPRLSYFQSQISGILENLCAA